MHAGSTGGSAMSCGEGFGRQGVRVRSRLRDSAASCFRERERNRRGGAAGRWALDAGRWAHQEIEGVCDRKIAPPLRSRRPGRGGSQPLCACDLAAAGGAGGEGRSGGGGRRSAAARLHRVHDRRGGAGDGEAERADPVHRVRAVLRSCQRAGAGTSLHFLRDAGAFHVAQEDRRSAGRRKGRKQRGRASENHAPGGAAAARSAGRGWRG